jgi:hypothetical protein
MVVGRIRNDSPLLVAAVDPEQTTASSKIQSIDESAGDRTD